jgi:hypothetical protein
MIGSRSRYSGLTSDLADILTEHITSPGHLQYGVAKDTPVSPHLILQHRAMFKNLLQLYSSLSFKKTSLIAALEIVADRNKFGLSKHDFRDFKVIVAARLMMMCRHITQAKRRTKAPAWVQQLVAEEGSGLERLFGSASSSSGGRKPAAAEEAEAELVVEDEEADEQENGEEEDDEEEEDEEEEAEVVDHSSEEPPQKPACKKPAAAAKVASPVATAASPAATAASPAAKFFFGWDSETWRAWRSPVENPAEKEWALVSLELGADDMAPPRAKWPDGVEWEVAELTSVAVKSRAMTATTAKSVEVHYSSRTSTGAPVVVKDRADREPLVSMYLSGKQVCQVKKLHVGENLAKELMIQVAQAFVDEKIEKCQLFVERDRLLSSRGIEAPSRGNKKDMKKPAAAGKVAQEATPETPPSKRPSASPAKSAAIAGTSLEEVMDEIAAEATLKAVVGDKKRSRAGDKAAVGDKKAKFKAPVQKIEAPPVESMFDYV